MEQSRLDRATVRHVTKERSKARRQRVSRTGQRAGSTGGKGGRIELGGVEQARAGENGACT